MPQLQKTALEIAAAALGRRACTTMELRRKLYRKGNFTDEEIEAAIAKLEEDGFLSDRTYAEDFVRVMQDRGYGPQRILEKLTVKGIDRAIAQEALQEAGGNRDPFHDAMSLLEHRARRINRVDDPQKRTHRILCMLAGRGFSPEVAYRVLREWMKRDNENE